MLGCVGVMVLAGCSSSVPDEPAKSYKPLCVSAQTYDDCARVVYAATNSAMRSFEMIEDPAPEVAGANDAIQSLRKVWTAKCDPYSPTGPPKGQQISWDTLSCLDKVKSLAEYSLVIDPTLDD